MRAAQKARTLKDSFWNSIEYVTYRQEKDEELLKFLVLFFLTSTASVDTEAIISYELWGSLSLTVMSLLRREPPKLTLFVSGNTCRKRYDMIALLTAAASHRPTTVPKAHHNLAQPIITALRFAQSPNSPQAIIVA